MCSTKRTWEHPDSVSKLPGAAEAAAAAVEAAAAAVEAADAEAAAAVRGGSAVADARALGLSHYTGVCHGRACPGHPRLHCISRP